MKPLTLAGLGCGGRTRTYIELAARQPHRYKTVAAADLLPERLATTARLSGNPDFRKFNSAEALLAQPKLADVMIIGTQDALHREHSIAAMEAGYDLLLEKPIANNLEDTLAVEAAARRLNRRVLVCHVLRYTPFYRRIKEIVRSGALGDIVSLNAIEGVDAWHQAHSYVRGHWAVTEKSSPMILAKSCHDLDIIRWIIDRPCAAVSSFGALNHFTLENAPEGAPERCMDGCPVGNTCNYNAERYLTDQSQWLPYVCDLDPATTSAEERAEWIHRSPWGRCVYRCDNTAVDHQTVNLEFEGKLTATFTMTAFTSGRTIEIYGTKARLYGKLQTKPEIYVQPQDRRQPGYSVDPDDGREGGYAGHGGGDNGLIDALHNEMAKEDPAAMTSSLTASVESHRMAFAAETSRVSGQTVRL